MNMPIEMRIDEITRSIAMNGKNRTKPIWNAVLISDRMNAGTATVNGHGRGRRGAFCAGHPDDELDVLGARLLQHELVHAVSGPAEREAEVDLLRDVRQVGVRVDVLEDRAS